MRKLNALLIISILLCFLSAALAQKPAEKIKAKSPAKAEQQAASVPEEKKIADSGFDVVLLIDSSGSMRKTDPHDYRKAASRLFISLMGEGDRAGVVSFGDSAKVLAPLMQNAKANRDKLFNAINKISSREFSTNIQDGVKTGFEMFKSSQRQNRILILMSDGKLTLGSKEKEDAALGELNKLLPELSKSKIKLFSVAFTDMSDKKLLEDMARITGGFFKFAGTDSDIHVMFTSIFEKVKSPDTIPLEGDTFSVDKDIKEVILVITKKPGTSTALIDPLNKKHTPAKYGKNMQWFESRVFDMITIKDPDAGKWKVTLSSKEGNRVFVITNLNLKSAFDKSFVNKGDKIKIDAWLERDGGVLKEKDVLAQVTFAAEIKQPDGKTANLGLADSGQAGDGIAGDGRYSGELAITAVGDYAVKIAAAGKTFKREKTFQFKAVEPPAGQKAPQEQAAKKAPAAAGISWKAVLIKFGIINLAVFSVIAAVYLIRKIAARKKTNTKVKKRK